MLTLVWWVVVLVCLVDVGFSLPTPSSILHFKHVPLHLQDTPPLPTVTTLGSECAWLIHFGQSTTHNERTSLQLTYGLTYHGYVPDYTYVVVTRTEVDVLSTDPLIQWVGPLPPSRKSHGRLRNWLTSSSVRRLGDTIVIRTLDSSRTLLDRFWSSRTTTHRQTLSRHWTVTTQGDKILFQWSGHPGPWEATRQALSWLAQQTKVMSLHVQGHHQVSNKAGWNIIQGPTPSYHHGLGRTGLQGEGEIIGVADTGLDWRHCHFFDPQFPNGPHANHRKVIGYEWFGLSFNDNRPWPVMNGTQHDVRHGHGTHVAGTAAGSPPINWPSSPELVGFSGIAPRAKLYIQDLDPYGEGTLSVPLSFADAILGTAYDAGVRIHSNSWGSLETGYTTLAREIDRAVWDRPDLLVLVAAGNEGTSLGSYTSTVSSPATAKSALSVGASQTSIEGQLLAINFTDWASKARTMARWQDRPNVESYDCCLETNQNILLFCCPSAVRQHILDDQGQTLGEEHMTSFSSRGPTADDQRIKPELVAPGENIVSAQSQSGGGDICGLSTDDSSSIRSRLHVMSGTSMATPMMAGVAALVRQYLREGYYPSGRPTVSDRRPHPSSSLIQAILVSAAHTMTGKVDLFGTDTYYEPLRPTFPHADPYQGFGRASVSRALFLDSDDPEEPLSLSRLMFIADDSMDVNRLFVMTDTGQSHDMVMDWLSPGQRTVNIVLAWNDYPAEEYVSHTAVNNLDLYVRLLRPSTHGGTEIQVTWAGNYGSARDARNPIERIRLDDVRQGDRLQIKVYAWHLAFGPQPYSVVVQATTNNPTMASMSSDQPPSLESVQVDTTGSLWSRPIFPEHIPSNNAAESSLPLTETTVTEILTQETGILAGGIVALVLIVIGYALYHYRRRHRENKDHIQLS